MKRALNVLPALLVTLLPLSATAASPAPSPSPALSPSLDKVLVAAPAGYAAMASTTPPRTGHVTAHDWAQQFDVKSAQAERLLNQDGFVDGYNLDWASRSLHVLNEFVLAFAGAKGAGQWFDYFKGMLTSSPLYQHADTMSGIPQYFGLHETQSSVYGQGYLDGFVFVKGNDVIGVAFISLQDDNLSLATAQTKSQYAAAPAFTIPPAQWPENLNPSPAAAPAAAPGADMARVLPLGLFAVAALIAIALAVALLLIRSRRAHVPARAVAPAPVAAAVAGTTVVPVTLPQQMSADGNFWYDGERWVDVNLEAPPFAQRSPDGAFWWDGYKWRPVAVAQSPVSGR